MGASDQNHAGRSDDVITLAIEMSNPSIVSAGARASMRTGIATELAGVLGEVAVVRTPRDLARPCVLLAKEFIADVGRERDDLLPAIDRAVARSGVLRGEIARVAVSIGPGGYTALRMACAAGCMIAEGLGVRCVGVPTALVLADVAHQQHGGGGEGCGGVPTAAALASKDGTAWITVFRDGCWQPPAAVPEGHICGAADLATLDVQRLIADGHLPDPMLKEAQQCGITILKPALCAESCADLGRKLPEVDPSELVPMYPREPDAVRIWREKKGDLAE